MQTKFPPGYPEGIDNPAMCLVCGRILNAGKKAPSLCNVLLLSNMCLQGCRHNPEGQATIDNAGECTLHSRECGSGTGAFFLVMRDQVLFIHNSNAILHLYLYLDSNGEPADAQRGRSRPSFLSHVRYRRIENLYVNGQIPFEISRARAGADRYISPYWY
jgi:hypothetical protein